MLTSILSFVALTTILISCDDMKNDGEVTAACDICTCQEIEDEMEVDCSFLDLTKVPENIPQNTSCLWLDNNRLTTLHEEIFHNMPLLQYLSLSSNYISQLHGRLLEKTTNLKGLYINDNYLKSMPEELLWNLSNLETISFTFNRISYLPGKLFEKSTNLQELFLDRNRLRRIPEELLLNMPNLRIIDLTFNEISNLPEKLFEKSNNLEELCLDKNHLDVIPKGLLLNVSNLRKLLLGWNMIHALPSKLLEKTTRLEEIQLNFNFLDGIPEDLLINVPRLQRISFSNNRLEFLHEKLIWNVFNLQTLNLSVNRIQDLPSRFLAHNKELAVFDISSNFLPKIHENTFTYNSKLDLIFLDRNQLTTFPEGLFLNMTQMRMLSSDKNFISHLPEKLFEKNAYLEELYFESNRLEEIPEELFQNMPELRILRLGANMIRDLPAKLFMKTKRLQQIYLNNNSLEFLQDDLLWNVINLEILTLAHNQVMQLPPHFLAHNKKLARIDLSGNFLTNILEDTFSFNSELEMINLSENRLEYLPERIFEKNPQLQELGLFKNKLQDLAGGIFTNNQQLKKIGVRANLLTKLSENTFYSNNCLELFDVSNNKLEYIPDDLFSNTPALEFFYAGENRLQSVPKMLFPTKSPINVIILAGNNISSLPEALFAYVELEGGLDLSNNDIEEIPLKLFNYHNKTHHLMELFLQRNRITYIQSGLFLGLPNLQTLCLFHNQIEMIGNAVFSTTSIKIFLFGNSMKRFSYDSFKSSLTESDIHLYRNNITAISGNATRKFSSFLYINCDQLQNIHGINVQMTCISPTFVPEFRLSNYDTIEQYIAERLMNEGFACTLNTATQYFSCKLCPQGEYHDGMNGCTPCPKGGFYQDKIGSYSDIPGQLLCTKCANGTYVNETGGTSQKDCIVCPDGTNKTIHAGFRACFCNNAFARTERFKQCFRCNQTGLNCSSHDFQSLEPGYFWSWNFPDADIDEYNAFVENLLDETRFYDKHTNYSKEIPRVHKCPRPTSCVSNFSQNRSVEGNCADGYKGWLCRKCEIGFYSLYNSCLRCPSLGVLLLEFILLICLSTLGIFVIWWNYKKEKENASKGNLKNIVVSRVKIVLGFYQVIGEYLSSFGNVKLKGTMLIIGEIISAIEMNVLKFLIRPQCLNERLVIDPKIEFIIAIAILVVFTSFPLMIYKIIKVYFNRRYQAEECSNRITNLKAKILTLVVGLLFATYPPICTSVFQLFPGSCEIFCLDIGNKYCFAALRADYDVSCDKHFIIYQVLAVTATVGYVFGFPLILYYKLKKYCSVSQNNIGKKSAATQRNETSLIAKDSSHSRIPHFLKFLCENYKSDYWYWEIVELARKVTQTVLITMLGWENKLTVLLTIGISVLFLLLHARYRPMKSVREQRLQMFSLIAILTNVVFIAVKTPDEYNDVLSVILVLLNISVVLVIILEVLFVLNVGSKIRAVVQWKKFNPFQAMKR